MSQTLFEKLQLEDEKNLLIQGLPSTIEKQFSKLSFSKNVTPLLKTRKIDFALVFALNSKQLYKILSEVCPALHADSKLWIAYPKATSKITSDLNRDCTWKFLTDRGFESGEKVGLDYVWSALRFSKSECRESLANSSTSNGTRLKSAVGRKIVEAVGY
ncbi:MAG: hypothetical protein ABI594_08940 [Ginsengibacter sp.]